MLDIKQLRDDPEAFDRGLARRGLAPEATRILDLDAAARSAQTTVQTLQARRNELSKQVGHLKRQGADADTVIAEVNDIKARIEALEGDGQRLLDQRDGLLQSLPNLPAPDVPDGPDESANRLERTVGAVPALREPKQHFEIGAALGEMDFDRAGFLSGSRFVVLTGALARLERALAQFMLDLHSGEFGYTEVVPPYLVRDHVLFGTGQLPKFADDQFRTSEGLWLIPTAEVPLTNLAADSILDADRLPLRYTAYTPCFRSEAGSAGRDVRGMLRQHQFSKVELVSITRPEQSEDEHERMTACAEAVLQRLDLAYRVMTLSTGDMGFGARKTYDIEVWLPGQHCYREISSCSNCGDFQARRMKGRFRETGGKGTRLVHTLNGSGLAVGRTLIAVLENYQQPDGSVILPDALRPYMRGVDRLTPPGAAA